MSKLATSLRKAAILISALDDRAADALLDQMDADEAAKVRRSIMELGDISAHEQQQVLREFLQQQGSAALAATASQGEVELELNLERVERQPEAGPNSAPTSAKEAVNTFSFLRDFPAEVLAKILENEHPQIAAVVVAQLMPEQAADVLEAMPPDLATEALGRLASLGDVSFDVQADLARALQKQVARHYSSAPGATVSLRRVTAVLEAMEGGRRQRVMNQLAARSVALARELEKATFPSETATDVVAFRYRPEAPSIDVNSCKEATAADSVEPDIEPRVGEAALPAFEQLALLGDDHLRTVLGAANAELLLLALTGAETSFIDRILKGLSAREAAPIRRQLNHPGPFRLREIDQAQRELARIAATLALEGRISFPPTIHLAAAM